MWLPWNSFRKEADGNKDRNTAVSQKPDTRLSILHIHSEINPILQCMIRRLFKMSLVTEGVRSFNVITCQRCLFFFLNSWCDNGPLKLYRSKNHHHHRPWGINSIISLEMRSLFLASSFAHARSMHLSLMVHFLPFFLFSPKKMIFSPKCITNGWSVRRSVFPLFYFLFSPNAQVL